MTNREIDHLLAGRALPPADPALARRISDQILRDLQPVRPLLPAWCLTLLLCGLACGAALVAAVQFHFYGLHRLTLVQALPIFAVLLLCIGIGGAIGASQMIPGSRSLGSPPLWIACGIVLLLALFALLFHDYSATQFLHRGLNCFKAGLLVAVPSALLAWLVIRRGVLLHPVRAGCAVGLLGGLAGVAMLELHCPVLEAPHILVWHVAVLPASGLAGALAGWLAQRFGSKRKEAELMQKR